jgi:hypothetical protein
MSNRRLSPTVARQYTPTPDACVHALKVLLDKSVTKMAARPAPEPGSPDNAEGLDNDRTATHKYNA